MIDPQCNEPEIPLLDDDVLEAMRTIPGYLDITPADFRELYRVAFRHACRRIASSVTARDIMTVPVITVRTDAALLDVADLMAQKGISGVPVLAPDGSVAGVISEKDFLKRLGSGNVTTFMGIVSECLHREGCIAMAIRERTAQDIMTSPAVTVPQHATLAQITDLFARKNINRAPVLDETGRLCGIVSREDLIHGSLKAGRPGP
jgi:CBS-domain-containing membrane protein